MDSFKEKYTTNEKIELEAKSAEIKESTEVKEKTKTIISNDAYAVGEMVEQLKQTINSMRVFLAK
jgi:hypothetical protein